MGRHYASIRRLDDMQSDRPSKKINLDKSNSERLQREQQRAEIAWCHNGGNPLKIEAVRDGLHQMSDIEQLIVQRTGCYDLAKVQEILELCNGDIEATVDNVIASLNMMANESKQQIAKALEEQKREE